MTTSLGVYVLGAADASERLRVEKHVHGCEACQAELADLAPLSTMLAQVSPDMVNLPRRYSHAAEQRTERSAHARRRRRVSKPVRAAALAACVAAIAGAAGGFLLAPGHVLAPAHVASAPPPTVTLYGADRSTHVNASAALSATSWGTSIELRLSGVPLNVPCRLIVRSRNGGSEISGVWDAWRDGPISVPASAGWLPSDIASLQVATASKILVTISSVHRPTAAATP